MRLVVHSSVARMMKISQRTGRSSAGNHRLVAERLWLELCEEIEGLYDLTVPRAPGEHPGGGGGHGR